MKRPLISSYDPLIFPTGEDEDLQGRELLMDIGLEDEYYGGSGGEKKRRLRVDQVRALEKSFEVDNKLDPDQKLKLAVELGLQPRQVAVWFQNRRARWKGKQLEHDYNSLKASYDALHLEIDNLRRDKDSLLAKIDKLKAQLAEDERPSFVSVKREQIFVETGSVAAVSEELPFFVYRDTGSAESDSSAVLNDDGCDPQFGSSADMFFSGDVNLGYGHGNTSASMLNCKMEDYELIRGDEEPCSSFFSDEQVPSLNCIDKWWQ